VEFVEESHSQRLPEAVIDPNEFRFTYAHAGVYVAGSTGTSAERRLQGLQLVTVSL
jgi:hypothetical protein